MVILCSTADILMAASPVLMLQKVYGTDFYIYNDMVI